MRNTGEIMKDTLTTSLYQSRKMVYPRHDLKKINVINKDISVLINKGKEVKQRIRMQASQKSEFKTSTS